MTHLLLSKVQQFCLGDGPGIRTTLFFLGCDMRCAWCHNPECFSPAPTPMYEKSACLACGLCLAVCPAGKAVPSQRPPRCVGCGLCADACPTHALRMSGQRMSIEDVVDIVKQDTVFYGDDGGVTCSGGEPLVQAKESAILLERCMDAGIHTAVETALHAGPDAVQALMPMVGLWICDIKCVTPALHKRWTGVDNAAIWMNLEMLLRVKAKVWIRLPLIPNVQTPTEWQAVAKRLAVLPAPERIEIVPYHLLGKEKYPRLGLSRGYPDNQPPSAEQVAAVITLMRKAGLPVMDTME